MEVCELFGDALKAVIALPLRLEHIKARPRRRAAAPYLGQVIHIVLGQFDPRPFLKGWQAPGNTKAMVRTFMGTKDMEAKKEIIWSFQKFKTLPKAAEPFFASIQEPELRKCAEDIRESRKSELPLGHMGASQPS